MGVSCTWQSVQAWADGAGLSPDDMLPYLFGAGPTYVCGIGDPVAESMLNETLALAVLEALGA